MHIPSGLKVKLKKDYGDVCSCWKSDRVTLNTKGEPGKYDIMVTAKENLKEIKKGKIL